MGEEGIQLNRRRFLRTALQAGALLAAPQVVRAATLGKDGGVAPSERIVLGGIGIGNRGTYDLGCFLEEPDVQFVAICDVKEARRQAIKKKADDKYGNHDCAMYRDLRELLARKDIDAVLIATGPNWHATAAILAANAGKDVYCEKPCTKNIAQAWPWPRRSAGPVACFRPARSGEACPILRLRWIWRAAESSATCRRSTRIRTG